MALRFFATLFALLIWAGAAFAQDSAPSPWEAWDREANGAREVIERGAAGSDALALLRARLTDQREGASKIVADANGRIEGIEAEIEALGPAPEDGAETQEAAELRAELSETLATARARQGRAQRAIARVDVLLNDLTALGQRRFLDRLSERSPSPINPSVWLAAPDALFDIYGLIQREVARSLSSKNERAGLEERIPLALVALGAGVLMLFGIRRAVVGALTQKAGHAGRRRRLALGVGAAAARIITVTLAAALFLFGVASLGIFGIVGEAAITGLARGLLFIVLGYAIAAALFAPTTAALRLSSLSDGEARAAYNHTMGLSVALGLNALLAALVQAAGVGAEGQSAFSAIVVILGAFSLWRLATAMRPLLGGGSGEITLAQQAGQIICRIALIAALVAPVLVLLGYSFAARFVIFPTILSLGIIALSYLIFAVIREAVDAYIAEEFPPREDEETASGGRLRLIPIIAAFVLLCAAAPLLALAWGADVADLSAAYTMAAEGLTIGSVALSPMDFVVFAMVFAVGYLLTRFAQRVLSTSVLPQAGMGAGGASALTAGVGYVGIFLAALAAISATGLDLSNLAIVAGALSVGVGFGLQNIVNNFVSGVILLVERPIKVGDWIEAGGQAGYVKKVNVRSTEIETFDRASFIMPNSDLIAGSVLNWTHSDMTGRVCVPVGVDYGVDPRQVETLLMEVGRSHPMVLSAPSPNVYFMGFGADSLDFELRVYLRDVNWMLTVRSDLNFKIAEAFKEAGIEIPFAQRDINIRNPEALGRAFRGES